MMTLRPVCSLPTAREGSPRSHESGTDGLGDHPGLGRAVTCGAEPVDQLVALTLSRPSRGAVHWSTCTVGARLAFSCVTVHRISREHQPEPRRTSTFKLIEDPQLVEKVSHVVRR